MLSRAALRVAPRQTASGLVARRGFQTTRAQLSSPYHYPEGPYTNIPFNPKTKWFAFRYWGFMAVGFGAPFGIAAWQTYRPRS
ncbi:cytochrome c oxidase subunit VIIc-domain-containing protein [Lasiosphaeria hispida]|uniref:Cytochrome c oxidase subunit 8, mitochondrial n=1 Tax=Lasiosphaeria hispida TaxID=260671 RepID=A0AAJ0M9Y1_9PEZI|nr:cytochrome c oxidase subunit VIIc-domain-containing protein [Lasiosphaeria hispida]